MAKANQRAGWRKSSTGPVSTPQNDFGSRGRERRKLLFRVSMLCTLAFFLLGLLVYVLYRTPPRDVPLILSVVSKSGIRSADDALFTAPNPYAEEDVDLLYAWFAGGESDPKENVRVISNDSESRGVMDYETGQITASLTRPLASAIPGGPGGNLIAMYLGAHGFSDRGTPYLAVGNSRADQQESWIPYESVLDSISSALDQRDDAANVRVVMFVDASRVAPQWDWGQFTESFANSSQKINEKYAGRIAVILSCSPGQRSWWDPRSGQGLFPQAIVAALTGKGDSDSDGIVTVGEVADFVTHQVQQTAAAAWGANQLPLLVDSTARDWPFISQVSEEPSPVLDAVNVDQLSADFAAVTDLWRRHNELDRQTHPPIAYDPFGWSTLEKQLTRLDQFLLAGKGYRDQYQALLAACDGALTRFEDHPDSLPKESVLPEIALRDYFHGEGHENNGISKDQLAAMQEMIAAWNKKPDVAAAIQVPLNEGQALRFLSDWIREQKFAPTALTQSAELLDASGIANQNQLPSLLETHLIRLLSAPDLSYLNPNELRTIFESYTVSRNTICANDLRTTFWIRDRLSELEQERMICIDRILSRDADQRALGIEDWQRIVKPEYESLSVLSDSLSAAYKLRDRMLHRVPRIAETLMADLAAFQNQEQLADTQSRVVLDRAITTLSILIKQLQLPKDDEPGDLIDRTAGIEKAALNARNAFDALNKRIVARIDEAATEHASDALGLRQNHALLAGSGTSVAERRQRVYDRLCELLSDQRSSIGTVQSTPSQIDDTNDSQQLLELMTIQGTPAWEFWIQSSQQYNDVTRGEISADPPALNSKDVVSRMESSGASMRQEISRLLTGQLGNQITVETVLQQPIEQATEGSSIATTRRSLEQWDTSLRSSTILFSHAPAKLQRIGKGRFALDQQLFVFDHAKRSMNEFWCGARKGEPPFFVQATNRLIASRNQNPIFPNYPIRLGEIDLAQEFTNASNAANAPSTLQPTPTEKHRQGTLLKFVKGKEVPFELRRPKGVPTGRLSIWSSNPDQFKLPAIDDDVSDVFTVPMSVDENASDQLASLQSDVFFRGLRRSGRIDFKTLVGGREIEFELPNYGAPGVRVVRENPKPERLLLVFDCSRSMRAETGNGLSRLAVAKNAVRDFLNVLDADVQVGLITFGDRYGFEEKLDPKSGKLKIFPVESDGKIKLRVEKFVDGEIKPAGLIVSNESVPHNPNDDVRLSVPMNPLDDRQMRTLKKQIDELGAIGMTPTYLAIRKAYEQLGRGGGHIIVLTDGQPKVVSTPEFPVDDGRELAKTDYQNHREETDLTIVNYLATGTQLSEDFPDAKVLTAADGRDLLRHLQSVRAKPTVTWEKNRVEASRPVGFGSIATVSQWPPAGVDTAAGQPVLPAKPFSIRVSVPSATGGVDESDEVTVQGGELFRMRLDEQVLSHQPYDYQSTQLQPIDAQLADAPRYKLSAGPINKRENQRLTMQIAIESARDGSANGKFTPRPSDIWVELTGMSRRTGNRQIPEVYSFSLPEFAPRQPIPILLCHIKNFPDRFDRIEAKAWFRFGDDQLPGIKIPVDGDAPFTHDSLPGVSFRTQRSPFGSDGIQLSLTEQYSDEMEPGSLRVMPNPLPESASSVLYPKERVVTRTFRYADANTNIELSAITAEEIKKKSTLYGEGTVMIDFDSR